MKPTIHHVTIEVAVLTVNGEDPLNGDLAALVTESLAVLSVKSSPYRLVEESPDEPGVYDGDA